MWRSGSGAAVRRTRGCALGCDCFPGAKTVNGFRAALGRAGGGETGRTVGCVLLLAFATFRSPALSPSGFAARWDGRQAERGGKLDGTCCAGRRPGGTASLDARAASCGPPVGRRPARAPLRGAGFQPCFCSRFFPARLGKSCQNVPAHFDDFPPKAWRAVGLRVLRSGRAGPTSRGRAKLAFRCGCVGKMG